MANPSFSCISLADTSALDAFASDAHKALRRSIIEFNYPEALRGRHGENLWKRLAPQIRQANESILSQIAGRAGVYAILAAKKDGEWNLKYIGQTTSKSSKTRICSHLVWRNKETKSGKFTGSKFDEIQAAVRWNKDIALSFVEIRPAALRHYVESYMIQKRQPEWNFHGTTEAAQRRSARRCIL
jgi:hypothetical protein